jgi:hypothetical protein
MKHIIVLFAVMLGGVAALAQSFELVDKQDSYQGGISQTVYLPLKIRNNTEKPQIYIVRKVQDDLGSGLKGYFCLDKNCQTTYLDEFSVRIEPGETNQNLVFTIETGLLSGQHFVKFEIFPRGSPSVSIEHAISITIDDKPIKARIFDSRDITVHDVYPNPVTDQAIIEYSIHNDELKGKVVIHNILGKYMGDYELPVSENKIKIQTDDLPAGIYFYTVYINSEGVLTRKLVVRK